MTWEWVVMIQGLLWWLLAAAALMARSAPQAPPSSVLMGVAERDAAEGERVPLRLGGTTRIGPD